MEIDCSSRDIKLHDVKRKSSSEVVGSIRINPKSYTDAFINDPEGCTDIYIEGIHARNSAMEGDIVRVKLYDKVEWKLNRTIIAVRWDDWSEHLLPIISGIEDKEKIIDSAIVQEQLNTDLQQLPTNSLDINGSLSEKILSRSKRNVPESGNQPKSVNLDLDVSRLPANLPPGIVKLRVDDILHLPFAAQCIQKTGFVSQIIKRNHSGLAGGFLRPHSKEFALFSPTDSRVPRMLIHLRECPVDFPQTSSRYKDVLFVAQIIEWKPDDKYAKGSLVRIVGDGNTIQARIDAILIEQQVHDVDFPPDAYAELDYLSHLPDNWFQENCKGRRDLTKECVFTIDPKTARDLDDAVSIRQIAEEIYEVGVHIADVSYFVKELTAVDYHARLRTTSVYLVDRVIPMLPRILCEQMCSLNPGDPKLTFSVIWKMDKYGRTIDEWFGRTVIKSCAKFAYEQVQDIIEQPGDVSRFEEGVNMPKIYNYDLKYISKAVVMLNKIAQNMRSKRFEQGALKIEQVKIKYELDSDSGFPTGFAFEDRKAANYLIEEYMLLANMAVAKRIHKFSRDTAFLRKHPPSCPFLMKTVKEFCDAKGFPLDITSARTIQKSLNAITDTTTAKVVSFLLLRAMKNAEYICAGSAPEDDVGLAHFALNVPLYTHFTSPIRRYADVIVHRQLAMALEYEKITNEDVYSLSQMADECTKRKISSKLISDTSQKLYFNLFVQKAGFCELLACVTRIFDRSFEVILVDYDRTGRVQIDRLKPHLEDSRFESNSGIPTLILTWKSLDSQSKKSMKKKKASISDNRSESRSKMESGNVMGGKTKYRVNEPSGNKQIIEVFDVIKVIVTTEPNDITQLRIDLKTPFQ